MSKSMILKGARRLTESIDVYVSDLKDDLLEVKNPEDLDEDIAKRIQAYSLLMILKASQLAMTVESSGIVGLHTFGHKD